MPALTGARFLAALAVVLFHFFAGYTPSGPLRTLIQNGPLAVSFFFILSGFVLTCSYLRRDFSNAAFWRARFARIYPIYGVALLLTLTAIPRNGPIWASVLMLHAWVPSWALTLNYPGWSLSCEAFFYLLFPLLVTPLGRLARPRAAILTLWLLAALGPVLYAGLAPHPITIGDGEVTADRWFLFVTYAPIVRLPEFLIGCVLGRMFLDGRREPATAPVLFGLLVLGVATATVPEPLIRVAAIPLMGLLVLSLATGVDGISRQLAHPWLVTLGEASYGLYILQAPLWFWTVRLVGLPGLTARLVFLALLIGAAVASYLWLETPLRRAIVRYHESLAQIWAHAQLSL